MAHYADRLTGGKEGLDQLDGVLVVGEIPHRTVAAWIKDGVEEVFAPDVVGPERTWPLVLLVSLEKLQPVFSRGRITSRFARPAGKGVDRRFSYRGYANGAVSLGQIAAELNERGIPTARAVLGAPFNSSGTPIADRPAEKSAASPAARARRPS